MLSNRSMQKLLTDEDHSNFTGFTGKTIFKGLPETNSMFTSDSSTNRESKYKVFSSGILFALCKM